MSGKKTRPRGAIYSLESGVEFEVFSVLIFPQVHTSYPNMPANKQRPPFRAEHLGSLLRPKDLTEKRIKLDEAKALEIVQDKELHAIEDRAIREIVKTQLDLGFRAINDGEYRRHQFWGTFFPNLEGFEEIKPDWDMFRLYVPDTAAFSE